jgi:hypothetical protein
MIVVHVDWVAEMLAAAGGNIHPDLPEPQKLSKEVREIIRRELQALVDALVSIAQCEGEGRVTDLLFDAVHNTRQMERDGDDE